MESIPGALTSAARKHSLEAGLSSGQAKHILNTLAKQGHPSKTAF